MLNILNLAPLSQYNNIWSMEEAEAVGSAGRYAYCSQHPFTEAVEVCIDVAHRSAPLLCRGCLFAHPKFHDSVPIDRFVQNVKQDRKRIVQQLKESNDRVRVRRSRMESHAMDIKRKLVSTVDMAAKELRDSYQFTEKWMQQSLFELLSELSLQEEQRSSSAILRDIQFYLSDKEQVISVFDDLLSMLRKHYDKNILESSLRTRDSEDDIAREEFFSTIERAEDHYSMLKENWKQATIEIVAGNEEIPMTQLCTMHPPVNGYSLPYRMFGTLPNLSQSDVYFPNISQLMDEAKDFRWSHALRMNDIELQKDKVSFLQREQQNQEEEERSISTHDTDHGKSNHQNALVFLTAILMNEKEAEWAIAIQSPSKTVCFGFGEVTEPVSSHPYYFIDSAGKCITNVPWVFMQSFPFGDEVIRFRTKALGDKLLVEYRADQDRHASFEIFKPSKELRFFVSLSTTGDEVRLITTQQ